MRTPALLFLSAALFLGCSVYQSNARKNFETRSPSYVVSFSANSCQEVPAPESFQEFSKSTNEEGQVQIYQIIPHDSRWYACTEIYASEEAWQNHQRQFVQYDNDDDLNQSEGTHL